MLILETARLYLRPIANQDFGPLALLWSYPDVMRFLPTGRQRTVAATRAELDFMLDHWHQHNFGTWVITSLSTGEWIGYCLLQHLHAEPDGVPAEVAASSQEVEIGYGIVKRHWRQGFAFEAAQAAIRHGFETARLPKVTAAVHPENTASRRILHKLGLSEDPSLQFYGAGVPHLSLHKEDYTPPAVPYNAISDS
jgi:RimJ/RimL family protein N-acetyltransferase